MTATEAATIREAADYLRGHAHAAHDRWTAAEAHRLADQLDAVITDHLDDPGQLLLGL